MLSQKEWTRQEKAQALIKNESFQKEQAEKDKKLFGPDAYRKSVIERGLAFIAAAKLIQENLPQRSMVDMKGFGSQVDPIRKQREEENEKIERIKQNWEAMRDRGEPITKESLKGLTQALTEVLAPALEGGKNKKNLKKILKKDLANAENHTNWKSRKPVESVISLGDNKFQVRIDEPITEFTEKQQKEWERITKDDEKEHPKWFKDLPKWEQSFLKKRVLEWQSQLDSNNTVKNLGDFLGVPPTTIRGYPGARNGYKSFFYTYEKTAGGELKLIGQAFKIRSGHISPDKIKDKKERLEIAKENIKQLILANIQEQFDKGIYNTVINLQTLITPPFDRAMDADRIKAIREIRKELGHKENFAEFLQANGFEDFRGKDAQLILLTSNYPVNKARAFANFIGVTTSFLTGNERNQENSRTLKTLKKAVQVRASDRLFKDTPQIRMAKAALDKMSEISGPFQRLSNLFKGGMNHNVERAALEQLVVSGIGGIRIGSCMSGKDREGGVTEHMAAMAAFYAKYGKMPPIPGSFTRHLSDKEKAHRKKYEIMVAKEFLAGHEQEIANINAPGSNGLKNMSDVIGDNVMKEVKHILVEKYLSNATGYEKEYWQNVDISELANKIASLNRIKECKQNEAYITLSKAPEQIEQKSETLRSPSLLKFSKEQKEEPTILSTQPKPKESLKEINQEPDPNSFSKPKK